MRKENLVVFFSLCFVIFAAAIFGALTKPTVRAERTEDYFSAQKEEKDGTDEQETAEKSADILVEEGDVFSADPDIDAGNESQRSESEPADISMEDALFIGDSRTVGLMEYAQIEEADFFCNVGMSVFSIYDKPVSVPEMGKVTLEELLSGKKYGKIYIMLGINEMGYPFESIVKEYRELIAFVREKEPETKIFLQANLHVTGARSDGDAVYNNAAINRLNTALKEMADGQDIFYLDANPLFDDEDGNLSSDKSADQTHLYAKYYEVWGSWIEDQTASLMRGNHVDGKR